MSVRNYILVLVVGTMVLICLWDMKQIHSMFLSSDDSTPNLEQLAMELTSVKNVLELERNRTKTLSHRLKQIEIASATRGIIDEKKSEIDSWFSSSFATSSPVCSYFPNPIPSAMAIWSSKLGEVVEATRHERDYSKFILHDFYAQILHLITPDRLQRSVKSIPHDWVAVRRIIDVAYERWLFVHHKIASSVQEEPPRLKIVVLGGSVMMGLQCRVMPFSYRMPRKECAWSYRLQRFLNNILGGDIVETDTIALGGTNSETGYLLWNYDLFPEEAKNPDIVINAYSTNDMHVFTMMDAEKSGQTLRERIMHLVQRIFRSVVETDPCHKTHSPLYIHMDDYLGNEQREILNTTMLSQGVSVLANYYGFLFVSYADVVRDFVYGDTRETWFTPSGWYSETGEFQREIHPGMAMHIVSTWAMAYNFLNLVTNYCAIEWTQQQPPSVITNTSEIAYTANHGLPDFKHGGKWVPGGKPKAKPEGLPPVLDNDLLLEHISDRWRMSTQKQDQSPPSCGPSSPASRCLFSWVSGLASGDIEKRMQERFLSYITENNGWQFLNDHNKLGFAPEGSKSHFIMEFSNLTQPVRTVTLIVMKSYGEKWKDSRIKVTTSVRAEHDEWTDLNKSDFVGYHNKNTSESYTHDIPFNDQIHTGDNLRIQLALVGGTSFKLMGLAVCSVSA